MKSRTQVFKIIWKAAKRDLLIGLPFVPLYSFTQVFLGLLLAICTQLIFLDNKVISLIDIVPGNMKHYVPFHMAISRESLIFLVPLAVVIIGFLKLIMSFIINYYTEKAGHNIAFSMREYLLRAFLTSSGEKLDTLHSENFISGVMQDTTLLQSVVCKGAINAFRDIVVLCGMLVAMLLISMEVVIYGLLVVVPIVLVIRFIVTKINFYTHETQRRHIDVSSSMLQIHSGNITIFGLRSQFIEFQNFRKKLFDNFEFMKSTLLLRSGFSPSMEFLAIFIIFIAFEWRMLRHAEDVFETYTALLILVGLSYKHIKNIAEIMSQVLEAQVVFSRISGLMEFLKVKRKIHLAQEPSTFSPLEQSGKEESKEDLNVIAIDQVSYHAKDLLRPIIRSCSLTIPQGSKVLFFGESGSGKTTLLRMIAGLLAPSEGHVWTKGQKLLATQYPYIFRGSVKENILYGLPSLKGTSTKDACDETLKALLLDLDLIHDKTQAEEFLNKNLGFMGEGLSGGEKARVALARLIYTDPDIVLLDEPTANLDKKSSEQFWNTLKRWKLKNPSRTIVAITHNKEEVKDFDICYVFEDGYVHKPHML
jgi:subfamily B ATP-binding cassette protein MsbA